MGRQLLSKLNETLNNDKYYEENKGEQYDSD